MEGSGRMLVTAVGENSQAGIIYSLLNNMQGDLGGANIEVDSVEKLGSKLLLWLSLIYWTTLHVILSIQMSLVKTFTDVCLELAV